MNIPLNESELWFLQALITAYLTGLIWTVQRVHYPTFTFVESPRFHVFHNFHTTNITWIVAPAMIMELLLSLLILFLNPQLAAALNAGSVAVLWGLTFLISVPLHNQLARDGKLPVVLSRLTLSNWLRTALWSTRTFGLGYYLLCVSVRR